MYNASLKRKRDNKNVLDYAVETAREEERAQAKIALQEADQRAHAGKREMARNLKELGMSVADVAKVSDLSITEIKAL